MKKILLFVDQVQNPVYYDNQANSGYVKAPLKHAFALALPKLLAPAIYFSAMYKVEK